MPATFTQLGIDAALVAALEAQGIDEAFPIQEAALPDALAGRDVVAKAPTGSGKTIAFGIPVALSCTAAAPRRPKGLILAPTRELAAQVRDEIQALLPGRERRVLAVYGGTRYGPADQALAKGVDVLVACPGRLEDLLEQGALELGDVEVVVIDEADRMADMGFLPSVRRILAATRPDRQVLLFSATFDSEIDKVVREFLRDPARHDVVGEDEASGEVAHYFWHTAREDRVATCAKAVDELGRAIVFCRTRHGADRLAKQLAAAGVPAVAIHGDRTQAQRERALRTFDEGGARALVATDVAARGIHLEALPGVIHFDPPQDHTDYTHRSGRTGRAGLDGIVVSLVLPDQRKKVYALQRALGVDEHVGDPEVLVAPEVPSPTPRRPASPARRQGDRSPRRSEAGAQRTPAGSARTGSGRVARERPSAEAGERTKGRRRPREGAPRGTVKFYDAKRGYGFVERSGQDDLFVHASGLVGAPSAVLHEGQAVEFEVGRGRRGAEARNVRVVGTTKSSRHHPRKQTSGSR
jgi:superfamily II DNA/RNA helicase